MLRGDRLKQLRINLNLTQEELGKLINVTKVSICGYEKETRTPNLETIVDLCNVLNTNINYLLGNEVLSVFENEEKYTFNISSEEVLFIKEIRKNNELHKKLNENPKRLIEMISTKLK